MSTYIKDFIGWGGYKEKIHTKDIDIFPKERTVRFVSWGVNIGSETDGNKTQYLRPVIVLKKIGSLYFCVPLTTKHKDNIYHYSLGLINEKKSSVLLSQARTLDGKRFSHQIGYVSHLQFEDIKKTMRDMYLP